MHQREKIISVLADGRFHSGEQLAGTLGISRTAVWKAVKQLSVSGIDIQAVSGKGYRLPYSVELLDTSQILQHISPSLRRLIARLSVHFEVDSTNKYLMQQAGGGASSGCVCLAERQTAGRGRRGRGWVSPFGGNIYLSILWRFTHSPAVLGGLSLALGVALVRALKRFGVDDVGLKWPNDVVWNGRKLAGILLEMTGESTGPCVVVAGIGLNINMSNCVKGPIEQPWIDLISILRGKIARNKLVGLLLEQLLLAERQFTGSGLQGFLPEWRQLDAFSQRRVILQLPDRNVCGVVEGVDQNGALRLRAGDGSLHSFSSGEISMRAE